MSTSAAAPVLPVGLAVEGRRCVVVGGGPVGVRRARALAAAGAVVVVVDPDPSPGAVELAAGGSVELVRRAVDPAGDTAGAAVVVCATGVVGVDEAVATAAAAGGALVGRADAAGAGDLTFPAVVDHGPLRVAVHGPTSPPAPAVSAFAARLVGERLSDVLGLDAAATSLLVEVVGEVRTQLRAEGPAGGPAGAAGAGSSVTQGAQDWIRALDGTMLDLISRGRRAEAKDHLLACLSSS